MSTTFACDHATFLAGLSPYNWQLNGSTYVRAVNCGAWLALRFTGTSFAIGVDVSGYVGAGIDASAYPLVGYELDGGALQTTKLTSSSATVTLVSGLSDTTHTIRVSLTKLFASGASSRWTGLLSLMLISAVVDTGKTILSPTLPSHGSALFFGDSITECIDQGVPTSGWPALISEYMGCVWSACAFGGQSWDTGMSGIPGLDTSYNLILSGVARSFSSPPEHVFINEGRNGFPSSATIVAILESIRSAVGSGAFLHLIIPFDQTGVATITAAYNSYIAAHPTDLIEKIDLGSAGAAIMANPIYAPDGIHPNNAGSAQLASLLEPSLPADGPEVNTTTLNLTTLLAG